MATEYDLYSKTTSESHFAKYTKGTVPHEFQVFDTNNDLSAVVVEDYLTCIEGNHIYLTISDFSQTFVEEDGRCSVRKISFLCFPIHEWLTTLNFLLLTHFIDCTNSALSLPSTTLDVQHHDEADDGHAHALNKIEIVAQHSNLHSLF